jgi:hypothetical protein
VMVPKRDVDGNAMSGVVLPDIAVPIASHGYMNAPSDPPRRRVLG